MKRLMIYFFYDKDGIVDDYVPYFLQQFRPFCEEICVVVNGILTDKSKRKLKKVSDKILIRENKGLDVEAYKEGLLHYGFENIKNNYDEVIVTNFTLFGPFFPLDNMFKNIEEQDCDWWAPFKWYIVTDKFRHIPSFFNVYKKSLISSRHFEQYWVDMPEITSYVDSVLKHEQRQTKHWQALGFKEGVLIDDAKYKEFWEKHYPLSCGDRLVVEDGYPFIKRRCFYKDNCGLYNPYKILRNLLNYLEKNSSYDERLILNNLKKLYAKEIKASYNVVKYFLLQNIHPNKEKRHKYRKSLKAFKDTKSVEKFIMQKSKCYQILKRFGEIFYKRKYVGGYRITRILCFKFKKKQPIKISDKYANIVNVRPSGREFNKLNLFKPKLAKIGKNTYSGIDLVVQNKETTIGAFCSIGEKVVLGHGEHPQNYLSTSPYFYFTNIKWKNNDTPSHDEFWDLEPIHIENDVWIGNNVFVKNGVTIGNGAIVGSGAVVTKDVPPYAIVGGVPAKIIKYRFDEQTIKELVELKWWDLDDEVIKQIPYDNMEKALDFLRKIRTGL